MTDPATRDTAANIPELRGYGMTFNITYSHVLCHAEVRKWKIIARTFMVLCLFADVVLIAFMATT